MSIAVGRDKSSKSSTRDAMLRPAFQLAHFIQGDGDLAARIATAAVSKLSVAVSAQDKRLYYRPGGRTWRPGAKRVSWD